MAADCSGAALSLCRGTVVIPASLHDSSQRSDVAQATTATRGNIQENTSDILWGGLSLPCTFAAKSNLEKQTANCRTETHHFGKKLEAPASRHATPPAAEQP